MKFAVVGAGATGGFLGARLSLAGEDVTLIARGPHLEAMRRSGLRLRSGGEELVAHPSCSDDLGAIAGADVVFLTVKAHSLTTLAPAIAAALAPAAVVVTAQNGLPWWYFERQPGPLAGTRLDSVDPGGLIAACIGVERVVGCVVYPATRLVEPGLVEHIEGERFTIGEPDGTRSHRCQAISAALARGGLRCPISPRIRHEVWLKLIGNVAFNPISALTGATMAGIAGDPAARALARAIMEEAERVAEGVGIQLPIGVDKRLAGAEQVGEHKTSMLQDLESGRPLELEALAGSVIELGGRLGIDLPHLSAVYACVRLLDATRRS